MFHFETQFYYLLFKIDILKNISILNNNMSEKSNYYTQILPDELLLIIFSKIKDKNTLMNLIESNTFSHILNERNFMILTRSIYSQLWKSINELKSLYTNIFFNWIDIYINIHDYNIKDIYKKYYKGELITKKDVDYLNKLYTKSGRCFYKHSISNIPKFHA